MSFRTIWREIKRTLTYWKPIENVPTWVLNKQRDLSLFEYQIVKGKHYLYKIRRSADGGQPGTVYYYKKRRI